MSRFKLLVSASLGTVFVLSTAAAAPVPDKEYYKIYYSDASHSVEVGDRIMTCAGNVSSWGVTSPYVQTIYENVCDTPWDDPCASWPTEFGPCPF